MKITAARYLSLCSYLGLLGYMMWWVIDLSNTPSERISILLLLYVAPLLITLRGVLHARERGLVWSSLIILIYLVHGGLIWWTEPAMPYWGLVELSLALTHLISTGFYLRWRTGVA